MSELNKYQQFYNRMVQTSSPHLDDMELIPCGKLSTSEAFAIYQNGYSVRLIEALSNKFENVLKILGEEDFHQLCELYIVEHPSQTTNITNYGENLPAFIRTLKISQMFPQLADTALYDQKYTELFHTKTEVGLSPAQLTEFLQNEDLQTKFRFSSSTLFFKTDEKICFLYKSGNNVERFYFDLEFAVLFEKSEFNLNDILTDLPEGKVSEFFAFVSENQLILNK